MLAEDLNSEFKVRVVEAIGRMWLKWNKAVFNSDISFSYAGSLIKSKELYPTISWGKTDEFMIFHM